MRAGWLLARSLARSLAGGLARVLARVLAAGWARARRGETDPGRHHAAERRHPGIRPQSGGSPLKGGMATAGRKGIPQGAGPCSQPRDPPEHRAFVWPSQSRSPGPPLYKAPDEGPPEIIRTCGAVLPVNASAGDVSLRTMQNSTRGIRNGQLLARGSSGVGASVPFRSAFANHGEHRVVVVGRWAVGSTAK